MKSDDTYTMILLLIFLSFVAILSIAIWSTPDSEPEVWEAENMWQVRGLMRECTKNRGGVASHEETEDGWAVYCDL